MTFYCEEPVYRTPYTVYGVLYSNLGRGVCRVSCALLLILRRG
jgi:hypothetical protein